MFIKTISLLFMVTDKLAVRTMYNYSYIFKSSDFIIYITEKNYQNCIYLSILVL